MPGRILCGARGLVNTDIARRLALEPELTITPWGTPIYRAYISSKRCTFFPMVTQVVSRVSMASVASCQS